ncbi:MAG: hypothetical protein QGI16_07395 [Candidatus Marinimicrobia bacterium]|nr:hypothetical protein [Candidatus Neomarinimicrobiota bacterium]MDP6568749.1 hypothetical protein [Candidatus Neomarinimicrobiota bacterium]MDP7026732.1 hypothetical protein [Candidatus Neomarinimicrobiota bacterium]
MRYILCRSLQVMAMLMVLSGLYFGIQNRDLILEIEALAIGSALFYAANWLLKN